MSVLFENFTKTNNAKGNSVSSSRAVIYSLVEVKWDSVAFADGVVVSSVRSKIAAKLCHSWLSANRVAVRGSEGGADYWMTVGNREIDAKYTCHYEAILDVYLYDTFTVRSVCRVIVSLFRRFNIYYNFTSWRFYISSNSISRCGFVAVCPS